MQNFMANRTVYRWLRLDRELTFGGQKTKPTSVSPMHLYASHTYHAVYFYILCINVLKTAFRLDNLAIDTVLLLVKPKNVDDIFR